MDNVKVDVKGNKLTIEVDLSVRGAASASGKSLKVASTNGNVSIPGHEDLKLGLNIYVPVETGK